MSPRKTILRELTLLHEEEGPDKLTRPASITGFAEKPAQYQKAVNQLLQDRLIEGRTDEEGRMAVSVNGHRLADVRKELRPPWAHPTLWLTAAATLVAVFGWVAV
jgi:hypothetical protein